MKSKLDVTVADVWIQCSYNPNVRHKLQKGNHAPFYECECLGISLGAELKEGDEVFVEPPINSRKAG